MTRIERIDTDHQNLMKSTYRAIFWGGVLAGALDITAAFVTSGMRGRGPTSVLHSVASGLLGAGAFRGGLGTAVLGLLLHFLIAFVAAAVYYAASRKFQFLAERAVVCGLLYGVAVYLFMNFVVLQLSAVPFKLSYPPAALATGMLIHMLFVGLPISLAVRRYATWP